MEKTFVSFVEGLLCSKVFLQLLVLLGPSAVAPLQINPRGEWGKNNLPPIDDHGAKPWSFRNTDYRGADLVAEHCLLPSNTKLRHKITLYSNATPNLKSTKGCPRPDGPPCKSKLEQISEQAVHCPHSYLIMKDCARVWAELRVHYCEVVVGEVHIFLALHHTVKKCVSLPSA